MVDRLGTLLCLAGSVCLAVALAAAIAWAGNTDPSGLQLKEAMEEYVHQGATGGPDGDGPTEKVSSYEESNLCTLATLNPLLPTFHIWKARKNADYDWPQTDDSVEEVRRYCRIYSRTCDFWTWSPTCYADNKPSIP